jgi:uncharacterized membrane protein
LSGQLNYRERNHVEEWFQQCRCGSTGFIRFRRAVSQVLVAGYVVSGTTTIMAGRTKP